MGSLESGIPSKKGSLFGSNNQPNRKEKQPFSLRFRSSFSRLLFKKLDYLQWICTVLVFLCLVVVFQMFLPGSVVEKSEDTFGGVKLSADSVLHYNKNLESYALEIGIDDGAAVFVPKISERFMRRAGGSEVNLLNQTVKHFGWRKPQLALVFGELLLDSQQLLLATITAALLEIGYGIQVFSLKDGPGHNVWINLGVPVNVIQTCDKSHNAVDWLNYDGIIVSSLEAKGAFSCFLQEPFKSLPLIWILHENALAYRSRQYAASGQIELLNDWSKVFNRSTVVVFPNYALPMIYSTFDAGNFYVIPGSPTESIEADAFMALQKDNLRMKMGYGLEDVIIAIVGSQFMYKGMWLGHAIILQALSQLLSDFPLSKDNSSAQVRVIVHSGELTNNYTMALEAMARSLKYPRGIIEHITGDLNTDSVLGTVDVVIYGSFLEEQSFPEILMKAMCFEKPIIAPNIPMIRKYVEDRVNGYLFPPDNSRVLRQIMLEVISNGKISPLAHNIASIGRSTAKNLMVSEAIEGYATLLQNILRLPSEVALPKPVSEISPHVKEQWLWHLFEALPNLTYQNRTLISNTFLDKYEEQWNHSQKNRSANTVAANDLFVYSIWEEEKNMQMAITKKRREEEELKDRTEQSHGTWEEVYRNAKRADRLKNDLHERDEGELERTGQPLCIYEPYFGEGSWPFLHQKSLYRGVGLVSCVCVCDRTSNCEGIWKILLIEGSLVNTKNPRIGYNRSRGMRTPQTASSYKKIIIHLLTSPSSLLYS